MIPLIAFPTFSVFGLELLMTFLTVVLKFPVFGLDFEEALDV